MVSLAAPKASPAGMPDAPDLRELSDAAYQNEVLRLPLEKSESHVEAELVARARQLGVSTAHYAAADKRHTSSAESASTAPTYHGRTFSTASEASTSTAPTVDSSLFAPPSPGPLPADPADKRRPRDLSFAPYDKYLAQVGKNLNQPRFRKSSIATVDPSSRSIFSVSTKRSLASVRSGFKNRLRWRRRSLLPPEPMLSCVCCRDDFQKGAKSAPVHNLPCGHTYCAHCLRVMVSQAITDEAKMPPRCCTQPIPGSVVKAVLTRDNQQAFLKAVALFSTPWESRIFCPNSECGQFIPPRHKVDPKSPFSVACRACNTRACVMCKRNAHAVGKDCPEDRELEKVLKMGEKSGWRRCYKCRNLVELTQGCTHMTCRCKAQFCYICGGVWDPTVGCPNVCSGEEELERRRLEEEERVAEAEAERATQEAAAAAEAAEKVEALERSRRHPSLRALQRWQHDEMGRFLDFQAVARRGLQRRHEEQRASLLDKFKEQEDKMKERHQKTASHLEDRQVAAEMELRASLDQSERSVRIRLKHMEAYCDGLGRSSNAGMPHRTVTERDLRELGQQYNLRDSMERLHQSKINVMRDRQAKRMEELLERQEAELNGLAAKGQEELEDLAARGAHETDAVNALFASRRGRLRRRWALAMEVLCKELEHKESVKYGQLPIPEWPQDQTTTNDDDDDDDDDPAAAQA